MLENIFGSMLIALMLMLFTTFNIGAIVFTVYGFQNGNMFIFLVGIIALFICLSLVIFIDLECDDEEKNEE